MKKTKENGAAEITKEKFSEAITQYRRDDVMYMLKNGILSQYETDEKDDICKRLTGLRSMEILDILSHQEERFPAGMLELDLSVTQNKNFVREAMEKYKKKFDLSNESECEKLFTVACETGSKPMVKLLISQKKGCSRYALLGCAVFPVFEEITLFAKTGFNDKDILTDLYFNSFLMRDSRERIDFMRKHDIDYMLKNSKKKSAFDLLQDRLNTFKYEGSRNKKYSKVQDEQTLAYIKKLEHADKEDSGNKPSKKLTVILCVCAVAIVACIGGFIYGSSGSGDGEIETSAATDTEISTEIESETETGAETETDTEAVTDTEAETDTEAATETGTETETELETETSAETDTEAES